MSVAVSDIELQSIVSADLQNAAFITQYDKHIAINRGYGYLYNLLCDSDDDYYVTEVSSAVTSNYALPADFMRLRSVDCLYDGEYIEVNGFSNAERNDYQDTSAKVPVYKLHGSNLRIEPQGVAYTLRIRYYPSPSVLISSSVIAWVTATAYTQGMMRSSGTSYYVCAINHTSGTFATDLAAAKWSLYSDSGSTSISYPNNLVTDIIATRAAILYRMKHKAEEGLLANLRVELANLEDQFKSQIERDDYKPPRLNDAWTKRLRP